MSNVGLSPRDRVGVYVAQLVDAVAHVHDCGMCHMDIKPDLSFPPFSAQLAHPYFLIQASVHTTCAFSISSLSIQRRILWQ